MDAVDIAKFKDDILSLIVDKENGADSLWLYHNLKIESLTREYLHQFLEQFHAEHSDYFTLSIGQTYHIQRTPLTKSFLEKGGFTKIYEDQVEKIKEGIQKKREDIKLQELKKENLQLINRLNKQKLKTHWIPIIISLLGLVIALASYFKPSKEVSKTIENSRLKNIEMKMDQLENDLKEDLDSLQNELYEAQMLIDSYES